MKDLSERRKADRAAMAKGIAQIAKKYGANCDISSDEDEVSVYVDHPGGLAVGINFERRSVQPDVHVIAWHIRYGSSARLNDSFGDVNPYHHRKATHVRIGWEALSAEIERGLSAAADGSAYMN